MKKAYWRWYARNETSSRLRRQSDEAIHVRSNGDLYFITCGHRVKRTKLRFEHRKQA